MRVPPAPTHQGIISPAAAIACRTRILAAVERLRAAVPAALERYRGEFEKLGAARTETYLAAKAAIEAEEAAALEALWALARESGRMRAAARALRAVEAHVQIGYTLMQQSLLQRHVGHVCPMAAALTRDLVGPAPDTAALVADAAAALAR